MEQDKLEQILLHRPQAPTTDVRLPEVGAPDPLIWGFVDRLPVISGVGGGMLGGIPGAALFGGGGEALKQLLRRAGGMPVPETSLEAAKAIGTNAATNAAFESIGKAFPGVQRAIGKPIIKYIKSKLVKPAAEELSPAVRAEIEAFKAKPTPGSMAEFEPMTEGQYPKLTIEEANKQLKLMGEKEKVPVSKDPFGLQDKMDRRGFLRRASGKNAHDAVRAIRELDTSTPVSPGAFDEMSIDEIADYFGKDTANSIAAERNLFEKLMNKYWDLDESYIDQPTLLGKIKRLSRFIGDNFTNEVKRGLSTQAKEALENNPEKAAEAVRNLFESFKKRYIK